MKVASWPDKLIWRDADQDADQDVDQDDQDNIPEWLKVYFQQYHAYQDRSNRLLGHLLLKMINNAITIRGALDTQVIGVRTPRFFEGMKDPLQFGGER